MNVLEEMNEDEIVKSVKISYDGRQMMIRIPREISDFYQLKKGDSIELSIRITPDERENRRIPMTFKIIELH